MSNSNDFSDFARELWADDDMVFEAKAQEISTALASAVHRAGLSRAQLAEKLGWKPSRVSKILTGSTNLTLKTIFQICQAIDLEFDVVLRKGHEHVVVVDIRKQHAIVEETHNNLTQSRLILDAVAALSHRTWRQAAEIKSFKHPKDVKSVAMG